MGLDIFLKSARFDHWNYSLTTMWILQGNTREFQVCLICILNMREKLHGFQRITKRKATKTNLETKENTQMPGRDLLHSPCHSSWGSGFGVDFLVNVNTDGLLASGEIREAGWILGRGSSGDSEVKVGVTPRHSHNLATTSCVPLYILYWINRIDCIPVM